MLQQVCVFCRFGRKEEETEKERVSHVNVCIMSSHVILHTYPATAPPPSIPGGGPAGRKAQERRSLKPVDHT